MNNELNPADLAKYTASEVANLADIDMHAVRDEGHRRHAAAVKKMASLQRQMAKAQADLAAAEMIVAAADAEARK
jgi:hypothetical protein